MLDQKPFHTRILSWVLPLTLLLGCSVVCCSLAFGQTLAPIGTSGDGSHFVDQRDGKRFIVWGVNYDHDAEGQLLDEYWTDDWDRVESDFAEIKQLGANCVRVHLQFGKFMRSADTPDQSALNQLTRLLRLAERTGLYLDITGLACYHKKNIPPWYDSLSETERWTAQQVFWEAIAKTCAESHAVFCYDLMNEPILPGKVVETEWLGGELSGKFFVQRIALDAAGRSREAIAAAWVEKMTSAIRKHDTDHMVTVGVIPWVFVFGGKGKPLFYGPEFGRHLDFVSVHFYPRKGEIDAAIEALKKYEIGKPVVVEEMFPLRCSEDELVEFVNRSATHVDGWISFYWGEPAAVLRSKQQATLAEHLTAGWLETFGELANQIKQVASRAPQP